jgi:hypothetical protein
VICSDACGLGVGVMICAMAGKNIDPTITPTADETVITVKRLT